MPRRTTHITQTYDTATNACGRLLRVDDGTGYQIFAYDRLGNVAENTRAIALPFEDSVYNFRMLYEYDTWNRVQRIVYPDSEVVSYGYDLGGQLCRVHTYKANHRDTLIKNILYDEFGHRTQVNFGNGVTTNYTYDNLQRLNTLQTYSNNANLQKISYSFDLEDNITKVENTAGGANGLGGAYVNTYNYDDLYRLTAANGTYAGNNTNYSLEMSYTPAGRLCGKIQDYTATANTYAYSQNAKPHAVRRYYNGLTNELYNLRWDNNGNLAKQTVYSVNNNVPTYQTMRMLFWDEDDRLNLVAGDGYLSYYAYGYDGNRAIKMTGSAAIDQTGTLLNSTNLENITIYPNEYLTVTQAEYTKYYYAGGNRIASKIGTGGFGKMTRLCTYDANITYNANTLLNFVLYQITNPTNQAQDAVPVETCNGYNINTELLTEPLPTLYITQTNLNFSQSNLLQQFRQNLAGGTEAVYYFHSDHLGSASWITDGTSAAVQHLLYLPFGEHFVNEQSSGYFERFTFTGKERDSETGYYYHGARFKSSDLGWLSVDPQFDKYPSLTPYNYCAWNPVKLVDPNGEEISTHTDEDGNVVMVYNDGDNGVYRHNGDREFTERELKRQYGSSNTSAGGEYMGKTKYWDEFMNHDNNTGAATKPAGKIHYGESWEPVVVSYNELSMKLGLEATAIGSLPNGIFDIKSHKNIAPDGAMTGKLLEGYYTSARSAGNFLAGLNGATARGMFGQHISYDTYISLAGLLHMQDNKTSRQNEYKGEIPYSGRRIKEGFELGVKIREGRL